MVKTNMPRETDWPEVIAALTAKRDRLDAMIATLRTEFLDGAPAPPIPRRPPARHARTTATRTPAPRSRPDVTDTGEKILAALRAKSPQSPAALATALKMPRPALTRQLKPLIKRGAVVATGATMNRQFRLPPRSPAAKEVP